MMRHTCPKCTLLKLVQALPSDAIDAAIGLGIACTRDPRIIDTMCDAHRRVPLTSFERYA